MRSPLEVQLCLRIMVIAAAGYAAWVLADRYVADRRWKQQHAHAVPGVRSEFERAYGGTELKIVQFYARDGTLVEGEKTVLCYGLVNAKSVRIEPRVEGVSVSPNRCVEVTPERDTRYTLTAEGEDGRTVTASLALAVHPDPSTLPKIDSFRIVRHRFEGGQHTFLLAFSIQNGKEVSIDPPEFRTLHDSAPTGTFYVSPEKTTTYTLTVVGKKGRKVQRQLTVEVPKG